MGGDDRSSVFPLRVKSQGKLRPIALGSSKLQISLTPCACQLAYGRVVDVWPLMPDVITLPYFYWSGKIYFANTCFDRTRSAVQSRLLKALEVGESMARRPSCRPNLKCATYSTLTVVP